MSLEPLFAAGPVIAYHALAAVAALVVGAIQLAAPKATRFHRPLGLFWAALMMWVAFSSFRIHELRMWGRWSPIHLLSIWVVVTVPFAVWAGRQRRIKAHKRQILLLYVFALIIPGLFTLLPGRIMHEVFFGT